VLTIKEDPQLIGRFFQEMSDYFTELNKVGGRSTVFAGYVGWWVTVEVKTPQETFRFKFPIGVLRVGSKPADRNPTYRHGVPYSFAQIEQHGAAAKVFDAYTGDYDLHCLYDKDKQVVKNETTFRPRTASGHRAPNRSVHDKSVLLWQLTDALQRSRARVQSDNNPYATIHPDLNDRLANLIQHGPQNLYRDFVDYKTKSKDYTYFDFYNMEALEQAIYVIDGFIQQYDDATTEEEQRTLRLQMLEEKFSRYRLPQGKIVHKKRDEFTIAIDVLPRPADIDIDSIQEALDERRNELFNYRKQFEKYAQETNLVKSLTEVDDDILAFTPYGEIYILNSKDQVYQYYFDQGINQEHWSSRPSQATN
jgi:hypothetical protein